jgi:hypothetical protein
LFKASVNFSEFVHGEILDVTVVVLDNSGGVDVGPGDSDDTVVAAFSNGFSWGETGFVSLW